jgi:hypothetical protein
MTRRKSKVTTQTNQHVETIDADSRTVTAYRTATPQCDFCGKTTREAGALIAGPTVFICDECTALCCSILFEPERHGPDNTRLAKSLELIAECTRDVVPRGTPSDTHVVREAVRAVRHATKEMIGKEPSVAIFRSLGAEVHFMFKSKRTIASLFVDATNEGEAAREEIRKQIGAATSDAVVTALIEVRDAMDCKRPAQDGIVEILCDALGEPEEKS